VIVKVKEEFPAEVGVPEISPVAALSDKPVGKVPWLMAHVYGGMPPLPSANSWNAWPAVAFGNASLAIEGGASALTLMLIDARPVAGPSLESVASIDAVEDPVDVGVPVISPLAGSKDRPAGSDPLEIDHV
jgi:hypothetical protein